MASDARRVTNALRAMSLREWTGALQSLNLQQRGAHLTVATPLFLSDRKSVWRCGFRQFFSKENLFPEAPQNLSWHGAMFI
jgi:hypothetical protein